MLISNDDNTDFESLNSFFIEDDPASRFKENRPHTCNERGLVVWPVLHPAERNMEGVSIHICATPIIQLLN